MIDQHNLFMKSIEGKTPQWETQTTDLLYETSIRIET